MNRCSAYIKVLVCLVATVVVLFWEPLHGLHAQTLDQQAHEAIERGNAALEAGDNDKAMSHYQRAEKLAPNSFEPLYNQAIVHMRKGDHEPARAQFNKVLQSPDAVLRAKARYNLGNMDYQDALDLEARDPALMRAPLEKAVRHYRDAINENRALGDARANIELASRLLKELKREKQTEENEQQQQDDQSSEQSDGSQGDQESDNSDQQDSDQEQNDSNSEGNNTDQSNSEDNQDQEQESEQPEDQDQEQESEQPEDQDQEQESEQPEDQDQEQESEQPEDQGESEDNQSSTDNNESQENQEPEDSEQPEQASNESSSDENSSSPLQATDDMTQEEAERLLQRIRDRDIQRRKNQADERARTYRGLERDW